MAGPEDLIARVAISGQDDVISSLGEIGRAGEEAFARLAESASSAAGVLAGIGIAVAGVGVAIGLLAEHGAKAQQAVGDLATATGESVENISAMQLALGSVGGNVDNLAFTMRRLASQVTRTWDEIQKSVQDRANVINASQLKVRETSLGLIAAQQKLREDQQRIGGGPLPGAAAAPRSPFQQQQDQRAEAELKYQQAVQASREAQKAASDAQRNDIANVVEAIGKVIAGEETLAQTATKINPTLDNVFKGIVGNSGDAAEAIKNFNGDYLQLASASPKVLEVLQNSAKFFKNSGDAAVNAALGLREFGRGSGTIVSALQNLGSDGLEKLTEQFKALGFATSDFETKTARQFNTTLFTVQQELTSLKDQIASAFQPVLGEGLKSLQDFIEKNRAALVDWAKTFAAEIKPAVLGFVHLVEGLVASIAGIKLDPETDAGKWKAAFDPIIAVLKETKEEIDAVVTAAGKLKDLVPSEDTIRHAVGLPPVAQPKPGEETKPGTPEDFEKGIGIAAILALIAKLTRSAPAAAAAGGEAEFGGAVETGLAAGAARGGAAAVVGGATTAVGGGGLVAGVAALAAAAAGLAELVKNPAQALARTLLPQDLRKSAAEEKASGVPFLDRVTGATPTPGADQATTANTSATEHNTSALQEQTTATKAVGKDKPSPPELKSTGLPQPLTAPGAPTNKFVSAPSSLLADKTPINAPPGVAPTNKFVEAPSSVPSQAATGGASAPAALDALASSAERAKNVFDEFGKPIPGRAPTGTEGVVNIPASGVTSNVPLPQPSPLAANVPPAAVQQETQEVSTLTSDFAQLDEQTKGVSTGLGDSLTSVLQGLTQLGAALAAAAASVPSSSQGKAEGGVVSGPGGPKDDKVPIMASAGEYVVTADGSNLHKAIAHFGGGAGGQQTFAQRTGITTNLGHIKDRVHYALGGLVEAFQRPIAHYAVGGPVQAGASVASGQRPINLFIGDEKVTGLTATDSAARSISRLAVARSVRSGGTKASWYRGS